MTTTETQSPDDAIKAYKQQVREEALRVAADMSWCDDGLNKTLRSLGLREKKDWTVPVKVTATRIINLTVKDGETQEEAAALVTQEMVTEYWRRNIGGVVTIEDWRPHAHRDGAPYEAWEADPTAIQNRMRRDRCHATGPVGSNSCTWTAFHRGSGESKDQHVAGDGAVIHEVWPVDDTHPVLFYGYPTKRSAESDYGTFSWAADVEDPEVKSA